MDKNLLIQLKKVTGYDFEEYINSFQDFIDNGYPEFIRFWSTLKGTIDPVLIEDFRKLKNGYKDLYNNFLKARKKMQNIDIHEFSEYIGNLDLSLKVIDDLPKYLGTSTDKVDIFNFPSSFYTVKQGDTLETISYKFSGSTENFNQIMDLNNLEYTDVNAVGWVGRILKIPFNLEIQNNRIDGILDGAVGNNILGKDVKATIQIVNDDLLTVEFDDCFKQGMEILTGKIKYGSIPEFPQYGYIVDEILGKDLGALKENLIANELYKILKTDTTLKEANITDITFEEDYIIITFDIVSRSEEAISLRVSL